MKLEMLVSEKLGKAISESSNQEIYQALMAVVQDMAEQKESNEGKKKVYYVSAEFLIGKLLSNNMINLGIYKEVKEILEKHGKNLSEIEEIEPEKISVKLRKSRQSHLLETEDLAGWQPVSWIRLQHLVITEPVLD